jgi:hypothetical protein
MHSGRHLTAVVETLTAELDSNDLQPRFVAPAENACLVPAVPASPQRLEREHLAENWGGRTLDST